MNTDLSDRRLLRGTSLFCLLLVAVISLIFSSGLVLTVLREYEMWRTDQRLAKSGDEVLGTIVRKKIEKRNIQPGRSTKGYITIYFLHYAYRTADGKCFEDRRMVPENIYYSYEKGGIISIKLDAKKPRRNLPEFVALQRDYEFGFAELLGVLSVCVSLAIWGLVFLCLTGHLDKRSLAKLLCGDCLRLVHLKH